MQRLTSSSGFLNAMPDEYETFGDSFGLERWYTNEFGAFTMLMQVSASTQEKVLYMLTPNAYFAPAIGSKIYGNSSFTPDEHMVTDTTNDGRYKFVYNGNTYIMHSTTNAPMSSWGVIVDIQSGIYY